VVVALHVAARVDEPGHSPEQLAKRCRQCLDLTALVHAEMMPEGRAPDKPAPHRRRSPSDTV